MNAPDRPTIARRLLDEIVYQRVLATLEIEGLRERERALREALAAVLAEAADTAEERARLANEAVARAWQRAEDELVPERDGDEPGHRALAAAITDAA